MKTNVETLSNFSEESLNEMAMENVEGGVLSPDSNITQFIPPNKNCVGCGTPVPIEDAKIS